MTGLSERQYVRGSRRALYLCGWIQWPPGKGTPRAGRTERSPVREGDNPLGHPSRFLTSHLRMDHAALLDRRDTERKISRIPHQA